MPKIKVDIATATYEQWVRYDRWIGTAEQLTEAGVISLHMLPGQPGRNKTCVTLGGGHNQHAIVDENYIQIKRRGKYRFEVFKGVCKAEQQRRSMDFAEDGRKRLAAGLEGSQREEWRKVCESLVDDMHKEPGSYRDGLLYLLRAFQIGCQGNQGYYFGSDAQTTINEKLNELFAIVRGGKVLFDAAEREEVIRGIYSRYDLEPPKKASTTPVLRLVKS